MPMSHTPPLLSSAQIHDIYADAPDLKPQADTRSNVDVVYRQISFAGREPGHPGHPPLLPESKWKKSPR